jgi:hypothetical protein
MRPRLQNLGWFMKCLKEPLSRLANQQDKTRGTFFEGRFKSVAVLDDEALLTIGVYIDLSISAELTGIFERLGCSAQSWQVKIKNLSGDRLLGRFFAASGEKLRELAKRLGVRHLVNLRGRPI